MSDFRAAYRSLRRSPTFVVTAALTLGVGIGLTTTMLSMLDAIRHPYVPYDKPGQLFGVVAYGGGTSGAIGPYEKQWALIEGAKSFQGVTSANVRFEGPITVGGREVLGDVVSAESNYFALLGARAEVGRVLSPAGDENSAVIGYGFWQRAFASRPLSGGLSLTYAGRTYQVVGVMPPEMRSVSIAGRYASLWIPLAPGTRAGPIVRLKDGVSPGRAYAELAVVAARLKAAYGEGKPPFQFRLDALQPPPQVLNDYQKAMGGAAIAILLIACANLANLMLVRGLARRKELSLRLALGAGRRALVRQLFTESALIAALGGVAGMVLTVWGIGIVRYQFPSQGPTYGFLPPHLSGGVFAVALATTLASVVVFGLGPAIAASGVQLNEPLKETAGTTTRRTRRAYALIVVGELALCLTLLMGSGLLLRAAGHADRFDFGYRTDGLVFGFVNAMSQRADPDAAERFRDLLNRMGRADGVRAVSTFSSVPVKGGAISSDADGPEPRFVNARTYQAVGWSFLRTLGVPVIRGRDFEPGDEQGAEPVAIIGDGTAERLWPGRDPVGRLLKGAAPGADARWMRVVGVARQVALAPMENTTDFIDAPMVLAVFPEPRVSGFVLARVDGNRDAATTRLNQLQRDLRPGTFTMAFQPWFVMWQRQADVRMTLAWLFAVFGLVAVGLAAIGLYGVLAYAVGQRMREFAVRIALGAVSRDLRNLVLRNAAVMILGGTAIGGFLAMTGSRLLDFWLFDVPPTDAVSLVGAELLLLGVAFLACLAPAERAAKADPLQIIRAL